MKRKTAIKLLKLVKENLDISTKLEIDYKTIIDLDDDIATGILKNDSVLEQLIMLSLYTKKKTRFHKDKEHSIIKSLKRAYKSDYEAYYHDLLQSITTLNQNIVRNYWKQYLKGLEAVDTYSLSPNNHSAGIQVLSNNSVLEHSKYVEILKEVVMANDICLKDICRTATNLDALKRKDLIEILHLLGTQDQEFKQHYGSAVSCSTEALKKKDFMDILNLVVNTCYEYQSQYGYLTASCNYVLDHKDYLNIIREVVSCEKEVQIEAVFKVACSKDVLKKPDYLSILKLVKNCSSDTITKISGDVATNKNVLAQDDYFKVISLIAESKNDYQALALLKVINEGNVFNHKDYLQNLSYIITTEDKDLLERRVMFLTNGKSLSSSVKEKRTEKIQTFSEVTKNVDIESYLDILMNLDMENIDNNSKILFKNIS